jgi:RNA methyltransferase, TrmH family
MPRRPPSPPPARADSSQARTRDERPTVETVQGLRAGLAVLERRGGDVLRVAYTRAARQENAALRGALERLAGSRTIPSGVPCVEASDAELERLAGSTQTEGLCVVTRPRRWLSTADLGAAILGGRGAAIALDRVRNPYNVGAILRTAAFFGLDAALLGAPAPHPGLAPTAVRVAEGGVERLGLARTTDLAETLARLRTRGVRVVGADQQAPASVRDFVFERPALLVMGHEREGLGDRVRAQCDALVAVRGGGGSGAIESLNVAVAAGVLLAAMTAGTGPTDQTDERGRAAGSIPR